MFRNMFRKKFLYVFVVVSMILNLVPLDFTSAITVDDMSFIDGDGVNGLNKDVSRSAYEPSVVTYNNNLVTAWHEKNSSGISQIRVAKWDGTNWIFIDGDGANGLNKDVTKHAFSPIATVMGSYLLVAWRELNSSGVPQIRVAKWDGTTWIFIDGGGADGLNKDVTKIVSQKISSIVLNGSFYLSWSEDNASSVFQIRVAKWDGTNWTFIDGDGADGLNKNVNYIANYPQLATINNDLFITWYERNISDIEQVRVAKWDGTNWIFIDGDGADGLNKDVTKIAVNPSIAVFNGNLINIWRERNLSDIYQVRVAKWDGTNWTFIDGNGANGINKSVLENVYGTSVDGPSVISFGDFVLAFWSEENSSNVYQVRVAKWDGTNWTFIDGNGANGINKDVIKYADQINIDIFGNNLVSSWRESDSQWVGMETTSQIRVSQWSSNTAPTTPTLTATPSTNGSGNVSIVSTVDDADNNELSIAYYYSPDTCSASLPSTTSTISTVTSANGTAVTSTGSYQVTTVTTTPGANIVTSTWDTQSQSALTGANGTYCIYAYAYDGTVTSTMATTTVTLDNVAPSTPSINDFTITSTALTPAWDAVSGASTYTVSSTATTDVTTSSLSYPFTSLTPNTEYSFQLKATDSYSNVSSYSTATSSYTNPVLPTSVTATVNGQTAAIVSWSANGNPAGTTYVVGNNKSTALNQTTTSTKVVVTGLTPNTDYYFKVKAISASGNTSQDTAYTDDTSQITTAAQTQAATMTLAPGDAAASFQFAGRQDNHTAQIEQIRTVLGRLKALLRLHSVDVTVDLAAGESQNVDLSGNGSNDTTVTMNSVSAENGASFTLSSIPQGSSGVFTNLPKVTNTETKALLINNGSLTTNSTKVQLNFNITNSELMAVSNDPEFKDISFEKYNSTKDWTLSEGNGLKTVFVKFRSAEGGTIIYSAQITLIGQSFDDTNSPSILNQNTNTTEKTNPNNCKLTPGQAYKGNNSPVVYYITNDCTKQKIGNEKNYFSYFSNWSEVKTIDATELNKVSLDKNKETAWGPKYDPKYGALVKTLNDPKVYLLLNDSKYWITSEKVFETLRYSWNWIEQVSQELLNKYTTKEEITTTTSHPNYTLVKYKNNPRVYRLEPNSIDETKQVKRYIPNETEFYKLNFRFDRVVTIPDTEVYTDGETLKS